MSIVTRFVSRFKRGRWEMYTQRYHVSDELRARFEPMMQPFLEHKPVIYYLEEHAYPNGYLTYRRVPYNPDYALTDKHRQAFLDILFDPRMRDALERTRDRIERSVLYTEPNSSVYVQWNDTLGRPLLAYYTLLDAMNPAQHWYQIAYYHRKPIDDMLEYCLDGMVWYTAFLPHAFRVRDWSVPLRDIFSKASKYEVNEDRTHQRSFDVPTSYERLFTRLRDIEYWQAVSQKIRTEALELFNPKRSVVAHLTVPPACWDAVLQTLAEGMIRGMLSTHYTAVEQVRALMEPGWREPADVFGYNPPVWNAYRSIAQERNSELIAWESRWRTV